VHTETSSSTSARRAGCPAPLWDRCHRWIRRLRAVADPGAEQTGGAPRV